MKTNLVIRKKVKESGVHLWQIADQLNIHDTELSKKMRYELSEEEKGKIICIINEFTKVKKAKL